MSDDPVQRFVGCLREARQLLHDPAVRQLLEVLLINAGEPFVNSLLQPPPQQLLSAPELGLEEVVEGLTVPLDDDAESTRSTRSSSRTDRTDHSSDDMGVTLSMPPDAGFSATWDPAFVVECRTLGALLREGPMHAECLFQFAAEFRTASRHVPERLDVFFSWLMARPRMFVHAGNGIVHAAVGADDFLSCKNDVLGYLAECPGYKSTASAMQEALPILKEEVRWGRGAAK